MKPWDQPPRNIPINPLKVLRNSKPKSSLRILPFLENNRPINPFFHKLAKNELNSDEKYLEAHKINIESSMYYRDEVLGEKISS